MKRSDRHNVGATGRPAPRQTSVDAARRGQAARVCGEAPPTRGTRTAMAVVVIAILSTLAAPAFAVAPAASRSRVDLKHQLDHIVAVYLELDASGQPVYVLTRSDGTIERLNPSQFANRLLHESDDRPWWKRLMNITAPIGIAWVTIGLLGQALFTGRMIVQWLASEKHRRSVVPPVFWWMSLVGATMLLVYFAWRKDIVGLLGQATGWGIYVRNLVLIYRPGPRPPGSDPTIADDPGPEPELSE